MLLCTFEQHGRFGGKEAHRTLLQVPYGALSHVSGQNINSLLVRPDCYATIRNFERVSVAESDVSSRQVSLNQGTCTCFRAFSLSPNEPETQDSCRHIGSTFS